MAKESLYARIELLNREIEYLTKKQARVYIHLALSEQPDAEYRANEEKLANLKSDLSAAENLLKIH